MQDKAALILPDRGILRVSGDDRVAFLQGLVSGDVEKVSTQQACWSALLTPQGKYLHDFFICSDGDSLLLDCEADRLADLKRRLSLYRLRSKVSLEDRSDDYAVVALFGEGALAALGLPSEAGRCGKLQGGRVFVDPRLPGLGARAMLARDAAGEITTAAGFGTATKADYDRLRIGLGLPDGSRDMDVEKAILLENGFDELGGVDWQKGCFMGQELTARTKYRALIKKRLLPVVLDGPCPDSGTPVVAGGREIGVMRSSVEGIGLALLRLEHVETAGMTAGTTTVEPRIPGWVRLEEKA